MTKIEADSACYIKLGQSGEWEEECLRDGTLRLGYHDLPHERCLQGAWEEIRAAYPTSANRGAVTRHINQVQQFYCEPVSTLWVTFFANKLWWCFADAEVTQLNDLTKIRRVVDQWRDTDVLGDQLLKGRLSGKLLAVQGYQGTICAVREHEYLLHKLNGTMEPHVAIAQAAAERLVHSLMPIVKNLHPKDLETLVDLIFRQGGWQRTGVAGEVERDIDLDLLSPITQERIAVQVKSRASLATFVHYQERFALMGGFSRFYFVTHSPDPRLVHAAAVASDPSFVFWGIEELAEQAVRHGLLGWLIDRAS